jgi:hypothetical protein
MESPVTIQKSIWYYTYSVPLDTTPLYHLSDTNSSYCGRKVVILGELGKFCRFWAGSTVPLDSSLKDVRYRVSWCSLTQFLEKNPDRFPASYRQERSRGAKIKRAKKRGGPEYWGRQLGRRHIAKIENWKIKICIFTIINCYFFTNNKNF